MGECGNRWPLPLPAANTAQRLVPRSYWIVLSPCIPFLVWSLYLRWRQGVLAQRAGEAGMDEGGESKKDK